MPQRNRQTLARNIRNIRLSRGWTQEQLAERCGFKRTYIGAIERSEVDMGIDNLTRIARRLRVSPAFLLLTPAQQAKLRTRLR